MKNRLIHEGKRLLKFLEISSPRSRKYMAIGAAVVFAIGFLIALNHHPVQWRELRLMPALVMMFILVPTVALINAARFNVTAKAIDVRSGWSHSLAVTILSTAANMLPIPGGFLVRTANMKTAENRYRDAFTINIYSYMLSATVTLSFAFLAYLFATDNKFFVAMLVLVALAYGVCVFAMRQQVAPHIAGLLIFIELLSTLFDAIRILFCFLILATPIDFGAALFLTSASVAGSAISIVPAGLGIREIVASSIAGLVALEPAITYLALAVNRLIGLAFFFLAAMLVSGRDQDSPAATRP